MIHCGGNWSRFAGVVLLALALCGCGHPEVEVQLPTDAAEVVSTTVLSGSIAVGEVESVSDQGGVRVAHVVLDDDLGASLLRQGVVAWVEQGPDGEVLVLDATNANDTPLSSGATIIARRRTVVASAEAAASRWARNGTLWSVGVGAVAFILIVLAARIFLRSFAGVILIAVSSVGAVCTALLLNAVAAAALVTWVYPHIGDGGTAFASEYGLPEGITAGLADPRVVAFFIVGLPAFIVIAALLRSATSLGKRSSR